MSQSVLRVSCFKSKSLDGVHFSRKDKTVETFQILEYLGLLGLILKMPFMNLEIKGSSPTGGSKNRADKADLAVLMALKLIFSLKSLFKNFNIFLMFLSQQSYPFKSQNSINCLI